MSPYEEVRDGGQLLAIVIRSTYSSDKIRFFTTDQSPMQIGHLPHKAGGVITPHVHNLVPRKVEKTNETLFVRSGKVKVNIYSESRNFLGSLILSRGDVILLCGGGHGFEFLEDTELIEVKQGPYAGVDDKVRFVGVEKTQEVIS